MFLAMLTHARSGNGLLSHWPRSVAPLRVKWPSNEIVGDLFRFSGVTARSLGFECLSEANPTVPAPNTALSLESNR